MTKIESSHNPVNFEIERKFLVDDNSFFVDTYHISEIKQYYLSISKNGSTRVRDRDGTYTKTTKRITDTAGIFEEDEVEITLQEFLECKNQAISFISKTRYKVDAGEGLTWEIDDYHDGLVVAEIELPSIDTPISLPDFIGIEITGDDSYSNAALSKRINR